MGQDKQRKGPSESATLFKVGTKKIGNDKNMWIIAKRKDGVKMWKKVNTQTQKKSKPKNSKTKKSKNSMNEKKTGTVYCTHFNGDRPFLVITNKSSAEIYKIPNDFDFRNNPTKKDYTLFVKRFDNIKNIHIGNSIKGDDAKGDKKYGRGNSILLQMSDKKFVFIGDVIFEFELEPDDTFKQFYSPIGRNDVPYPLVLGDKNVYFMMKIESSYHFLPRDLKYFDDFPEKHRWALNAYDVYFGNSDLSNKNIKNHYKKLRKLKIYTK